MKPQPITGPVAMEDTIFTGQRRQLAMLASNEQIMSRGSAEGIGEPIVAQLK